MLNRPYQNDRSDRGIISCFYSKLDFIIAITVQKSILKGDTLLSIFTCKCMIFTEATSFVYFLYITNISLTEAGGTGLLRLGEPAGRSWGNRPGRGALPFPLRN